MIFDENPLKDAYRRVVWGPARQVLEAAPAPWETHAIRGLGRLAAAAARGKRRALRDNLARAFPERAPAELDAIARQAFAAHFSNQYASFSFAKCTAEAWPRYLRLDGLERLPARGVVLMHPHTGPAQLPLLALGHLGRQVHQVGGGRVTLVELSATGKWAAETRARLESRLPVTLHDGRAYLRPLLRALRDGGVVMTAGDATGGGEELGRRLVRRVLGQAMPLPVGPVWMALRSGAPLHTLVCHRNRAGLRPPFVAEVGAEIPLLRHRPLDEALQDGADRVAAWLDGVLRQHPGDWHFWDGFRPGGLLVVDEGGS